METMTFSALHIMETTSMDLKCITHPYVSVTEVNGDLMTMEVHACGMQA